MARPATGQVVERQGKGSRSYALRFRAYGRREYVTLGTRQDGWTRARAQTELDNVLADVRRGIWRPPAPDPVEAPRREPTFHEFASEWLEARRHELSERTVEDYRWALVCHLLPFFHRHRLGHITVREVDRYRAAKVREGDLSASSINKTITRLSQVLALAVEYDLLAANPAAGRARRLKAPTPRRKVLEPEQVAALLSAAGRHRALLATAVMAGGLGVSELIALRWRDVNLAGGWLEVTASKTNAGVRRVDLAPELLDELKAHKLGARWAEPDDFVFPGRDRRRPRERNSVRTRVLYPALERANAALTVAGRQPIPAGVTFHSLRRTYASLEFADGADPAYVQGQIGHRTARLTLEMYAQKGSRRRPDSHLGELLAASEWARMGTNAEEVPDPPPAPEPVEEPDPLCERKVPDGAYRDRTGDLLLAKEDEEA